MNRALLGYGIALVLAYAGAYVTWRHHDELALAESVVILPGKPEELESIRYEAKDVALSLAASDDAFGRYVWVRSEPKPKPEDEAPAADEDDASPLVDDPHAPPPKPKPETKPEDLEPKEFKAGKAGDTLLEGLAPFVAKRELDALDPGALAEIGLAEPEATLTITRNGKPAKTFELGNDVYGGANVYVREPETGKVYLVEAQVLRPLKSGAQSLPDATLFDAPTKDIQRVELHAGEANVAFAQHNPDDAEARFWSTEGESSKNDAASAWLDKALRLRSSQFVAAGSEPGTLDEVFDFTVVPRNGKPVRIAVFRNQNENGEDEWYARSEHTRALVKLHTSLAAELFADLPSALGREHAS